MEHSPWCIGCVSNAQNGKCAEPSLSRHPHHHCRLNSILKLRTLQLLSTASLSLSSGCSEAAVALARAFLVHAVGNESGCNGLPTQCSLQPQCWTRKCVMCGVSRTLVRVCSALLPISASTLPSSARGGVDHASNCHAASSDTRSAS